MTTQQMACKEAIDKLLQRVSSLEDTIIHLTSYLRQELGSAAANEIIERIQAAKRQGEVE